MPNSIRLPRRQSILEVERKFRRLAVETLTQNGGTPPFQSLRALPTKTIHDVYYDKADVLYKAGTWVRKRNGAWEAKIRKGGDFTNSRFEELSDARDIAACVRGITDVHTAEGQNFGLERMAEFTTARQTWVADGEFVIVRDCTDFGHEVGEVELQVELEGATEAEKKRMMGEMDGRIVRFMDRYAWAFARGKPVGKLVAYFEAMDKRKKRKE